jgi:hypothetical protein
MSAVGGDFGIPGRALRATPDEGVRGYTIPKKLCALSLSPQARVK